jgi:hypothetical protein
VEVVEVLPLLQLAREQRAVVDDDSFGSGFTLLLRSSDCFNNSSDALRRVDHFPCKTGNPR